MRRASLVACSDLGEWSAYGGGAQGLNPGGGQRRHTLVAFAVTRGAGEHLNLGVEVCHETPAVAGGAALTNLGLGRVGQFATHRALTASGGPGLERPSCAGSSAFYLSNPFTD